MNMTSTTNLNPERERTVQNEWRCFRFGNHQKRMGKTTDRQRSYGWSWRWPHPKLQFQ